MSKQVNADVWAQTQLDIFFTADSGPPPSGADGDLTGQCVTLDKWFFAEMCPGFPSPFAARGHARYLGDNLVAQGLATVVPAGQQKRGDIVCYIYGEYGHTGVLLSGNRFFQQNAQAAGARKKTLPDGTVVYSSTIVNLYSSLGGVAPKFYRLKAYKEGNNMTIEQARYEAQRIGLLGHMSEAQITPEWVEEQAVHMVADPAYAAAVCKQLYEGAQWQNDVWKAVHFEEEKEKAYQRGLAEAGGLKYVPAPPTFIEAPKK